MAWNPSADHDMSVCLQVFGFVIDLPSEEPVFLLGRGLPDCRKSFL